MHQIEPWSDCAPETSKAVAMPYVGNKEWGNLTALALSDQPKKICLLGSVPFYRRDFTSPGDSGAFVAPVGNSLSRPVFLTYYSFKYNLQRPLKIHSDRGSDFVHNFGRCALHARD
jgi:hypothetical protein